MRILSVSNFYETHGGGLERVAGHLCREFTRAGHTATWAACDNDTLPEGPASLLPLRCMNWLERKTGLPMPIPGPGPVWRLWQGVRAHDLIVIHDALYASSIAAMLMARVARKPTVLIQHIGSITFARPALSRLMALANRLVTQPMMKAADRLVFISATVRDELLGPGSPLPSRLVFNGVDSEVFHPDPREDRQALRDQLEVPANAQLAIFVGRYVEKKGLDVLREVARLRPDMQFAMIGKGPLDPASWGLGNVHDLGQLDQRRLARIYRAGDMLLLPSVGEGFPLVVQEAMACGLPVVTGDVTARADPGASAFLRGVRIELDDVKASAQRCSEAIDQLTRAPQDPEAMAHYAHATYNWAAMAREIIRPG